MPRPCGRGRLAQFRLPQRFAVWWVALPWPILVVPAVLLALCRIVDIIQCPSLALQACCKRLPRHRLHSRGRLIQALIRNRSTVGKTANSLVSPRRQQLAPSGRARLVLEPRRSAVLSSGLTTHGGGLGPFLAVWTPRFSTFLYILRAICSVHGYPTQRVASTSSPRSDRFWLLPRQESFASLAHSNPNTV